jgi:hypothetical protein
MKIENKLGPSDFSAVTDAFRDGEADSIELLPAIDYGFVRILPLIVSRYESGYIVSTRMFFEDPIGNTVFVNTGTEERGIWKRSKEIELEFKKPLSASEELGKDIAYGLLLVEKIVNYACAIRDKNRFDSYVVDSKLIDKQIEKEKKKENRDTKNLNTSKSFTLKQDMIFTFNQKILSQYFGNTTNTTCLVGKKRSACFQEILSERFSNVIQQHLSLKSNSAKQEKKFWIISSKGNS